MKVECPLNEREENAERIMSLLAGDLGNGRGLYKQLMTFCYPYISKENEQEDLIGGLYLHLIKGGAKTYQYKITVDNPFEDSYLMGWLHRCVKNRSISQLRKNGREKSITLLYLKGYEEFDSIEDDFKDIQESCLDQLIKKEKMRIVTGKIPELTEKRKEILYLSFLLELPHSEIARRLNIPKGTVKSRVYYAKKQLNGLIENK